MDSSTIHGTIIVPWQRICRANYSCTPRIEFETGAPNLTTASDDNVSFFCYLEQFNYSPKPIPGGMWGDLFRV